MTEKQGTGKSMHWTMHDEVDTWPESEQLKTKSRFWFDRHGGLREVWVVVIFVATLVLVSLAVFAVADAMNRASCENVQEVTGRRTVYRTMGGCFIDTKVGMVPIDQLSTVEGVTP